MCYSDRRCLHESAVKDQCILQPNLSMRHLYHYPHPKNPRTIFVGALSASHAVDDHMITENARQTHQTLCLPQSVCLRQNNHSQCDTMNSGHSIASSTNTVINTSIKTSATSTTATNARNEKAVCLCRLSKDTAQITSYNERSDNDEDNELVMFNICESLTLAIWND